MSAEPEQATCCEPDLLTDGLGEVGLALVVAGFAGLWKDLALRPKELVPTHPDGAREVARVLAERGRCELSEEGRVVGLHGLTLRPGRHRFSVANSVHPRQRTGHGNRPRLHDVSGRPLPPRDDPAPAGAQATAARRVRDSRRALGSSERVTCST